MNILHSPRVGVVGGGSWATAIAKLLVENCNHINWFVRKQENIERFIALGHNPSYLTSVEFDIDRITFTSDINALIEESDVIVFVVPSAFITQVMANVNVSLADKLVVSAIKGIIPDLNLVVGDYLTTYFHLPLEQLVVVSGPCHAEEIALERLSYLTFASSNTDQAQAIADLFSCTYVKTIISNDVFGTEFAAVMKNVFAIAAGICHGLHYGDNFQAVLVSSAAQEMRRFLAERYPMERDVKQSAYLGDLLVTCYSQFSRNRTFGTLIGKGYSVQAVQAEMLMIAEGYYGVKGVMELNKEYNISLPITEMVYSVLYKGRRPDKAVADLLPLLK